MWKKLFFLLSSLFLHKHFSLNFHSCRCGARRLYCGVAGKQKIYAKLASPPLECLIISIFLYFSLHFHFFLSSSCFRLHFASRVKNFPKKKVFAVIIVLLFISTQHETENLNILFPVSVYVAERARASWCGAMRPMMMASPKGGWCGYFVNNSRFSPTIFQPLFHRLRGMLNFFFRLSRCFSSDARNHKFLPFATFFFQLTSTLAVRKSLDSNEKERKKLTTRARSSAWLRELKISWKLCHTFMYVQITQPAFTDFGDLPSAQTLDFRLFFSLEGKLRLSSVLNLGRANPPTDPTDENVLIT